VIAGKTNRGYNEHTREPTVEKHTEKKLFLDKQIKYAKETYGGEIHVPSFITKCDQIAALVFAVGSFDREKLHSAATWVTYTDAKFEAKIKYFFKKLPEIVRGEYSKNDFVNYCKEDLR